MAVKLITGDILSNWGDADIIYLSGHTDINPAGNYYLNNSIMAAMKNLIPDFNEIFVEKVNEAKQKHLRNGREENLYGIATHEIPNGDEIVQRIGIMFLRDDWDKPPRPDMFNTVLTVIVQMMSTFILYNQPLPRIVIQDPITADIKPGPKTTEAILRLYEFYPSYIEVWRPET